MSGRSVLIEALRGEGRCAQGEARGAQGELRAGGLRQGGFGDSSGPKARLRHVRGEWQRYDYGALSGVSIRSVALRRIFDSLCSGRFGALRYVPSEKVYAVMLRPESEPRGAEPWAASFRFTHHFSGGGTLFARSPQAATRNIQSITDAKYVATNASQMAARNAASGGEVPLYAFLRRLRPAIYIASGKYMIFDI